MEQQTATYGLDISKVLRDTLSLMPRLPYHNQRHANDVYATTLELIGYEGVAAEDREILAIAAAFHDVNFELGNKYNEESSVAVFRKYAKRKLDYQLVETVAGLILATKFPTHPKSLLERILCDADVANLGRKDFFVRGEEVRQELLALGNTAVSDDLTWYRRQTNFLRSHKYYTSSAQGLYDGGKKRNLEELERRINYLEASK